MVELFQGVYGVRPHKEKINISKEIINKTRGAEAPYVARIYRKRRRRDLLFSELKLPTLLE